MNINKDTALSIARAFAEREHKDERFPLQFDGASVKLERGGFGHTYLGLGERYWSVLFNLSSTDSDVAVITPDHVIVLVDAESGKATWFPVM